MSIQRNSETVATYLGIVGLVYVRGNDHGKNSQLVWSVIMVRKMEQLLLPLLPLCVFLSRRNNIF